MGHFRAGETGGQGRQVMGTCGGTGEQVWGQKKATRGH